ncbi:MAG TPA: WecB/TagA/CpsF family glycosyltransferase [Chromatiales bacterium]|nr:WecB/TagA/CpsF family glycosyltransferase [Chromatiales bacterium]
MKSKKAKQKTMSEKYTVYGLAVETADLQQNANRLLGLLKEDRGAWIVTLNTEMLAKINKDSEYHDLLKQADIYYADGMPLVWASWLGHRRQRIAGRTTGVDLVEHILNLDQIPNFAIIGGVDPERTLERYPGAQDACKFIFNGIVDGSEEQIQYFVETIEENSISIVFLALGVPKQDRVALQLRKRLPNVILAGIGGTFEILGPEGGRAPLWMQNAGLEWLYRLGKEPGRLWKRYIIECPSGVLLLLKERFHK